MSAAELSLGFPASRELWTASTADEWRTLYLQQETTDPDWVLSISQSISCVSQLKCQSHIDLAFAASLVTYSTWALAHCDFQLNSLTVGTSSLSNSRQASFNKTTFNPGVSHLIEETLLLLSDLEGTLRPELNLVAQRTLLNLHVPFETVQLFAGKEGEEEARRAYPTLQRWVNSRDARKAIWHAGQILKAARLCQQKDLRDFGAICVYHAGLTFWAYAIVLAATRNKVPAHSQPQSSSMSLTPDASVQVWLDDDDCPAVQRFIGLDRGVPVVRAFPPQPVRQISLADPKALMEMCIALLQKETFVESPSGHLPVVSNLCQLMADLGNAAQGLLSEQLRRSKEAGT